MPIPRLAMHKIRDDLPLDLWRRPELPPRPLDTGADRRLGTEDWAGHGRAGRCILESDPP